MTRVWTSLFLSSGEIIALDGPTTHHLRHVLRRKIGQDILIFNDQDGEWHGVIDGFDKKNTHVRVMTQHRPPPPKKSRIHLLFAPLKQGPLSFLMEKSVELGVDVLMPQKTDHTVVPTINEDRARLHIQEAAEQCGRLTIPTLMPLESLHKTLATWDNQVPLFVCDERRGGMPLMQALSEIQPEQDLFFLSGPEGGFSKAEFKVMAHQSFIRFVTLNPHILRAETAALAAVAVAVSYRQCASQRVSL